MKWSQYYIAILAVWMAAVSLPAVADKGMGVTWRRFEHYNGTDLVGCGAGPGETGCNAYNGETPCGTRLPVLCLKQDNSPSPIPTDFYHGWAKGNIALTRAVRGDAFKSKTEINAFCAAELGSGYRIAEHHDGGGGWGWWAYGHVDNTTRFWVTVDRQPSSCWH